MVLGSHGEAGHPFREPSDPFQGNLSGILSGKIPGHDQDLAMAVFLVSLFDGIEAQ